MERLPELAEELVRLKVDLIAVRATPVVQAAKNATTTVPIVMLGGCRSGGEWVRREPGATGREHYGIGNASPGAERKTTGAFEGDRS